MAAFQELLAAKTGVAPALQELLAGFPPQVINLPPDRAAATVASLGLHSGDNLTVRQLAGAPPPAAAAEAPPVAAAAAADPFSVAGMVRRAAGTVSHRRDHTLRLFATPKLLACVQSEDEQLARAIAASLGEPAVPPPQPARPAAAAAPPPPQPSRPAVGTLGGLEKAPAKGAPTFERLPDGSAVARRVVADDNSCLFSAVGYVQRGTRAAAPQLRAIVADAVAADPARWHEAVLGKAPAAYSAWILGPKNWGGAIELSIFSRAFGREIAAFDVQTQRVDVYGQGEGYEERVMLIYDGAEPLRHPLFVSCFACFVTTCFATTCFACFAWRVPCWHDAGHVLVHGAPHPPPPRWRAGLHYDALAVAQREGAPEAGDATVLPSSGARTDAAMAGAARLVARAHAARQFTGARAGLGSVKPAPLCALALFLTARPGVRCRHRQLCAALRHLQGGAQGRGGGGGARHRHRPPAVHGVLAAAAPRSRPKTPSPRASSTQQKKGTMQQKIAEKRQNGRQRQARCPLTAAPSAPALGQTRPWPPC